MSIDPSSPDLLRRFQEALDVPPGAPEEPVVEPPDAVASFAALQGK